MKKNESIRFLKERIFTYHSNIKKNLNGEHGGESSLASGICQQKISENFITRQVSFET